MASQRFMFVMDLLSCGVVFWQNPWQAAGLYSRRTVTLTTPAFPVFASGDDVNGGVKTGHGAEQKLATMAAA